MDRRHLLGSSPVLERRLLTRFFAVAFQSNLWHKFQLWSVTTGHCGHLEFYLQHKCCHERKVDLPRCFRDPACVDFQLVEANMWWGVHCEDRLLLFRLIRKVRENGIYVIVKLHLFEDERLDLPVCYFGLELLWIWIRVLFRDEEEGGVAMAVALLDQLIALS